MDALIHLCETDLELLAETFSDGFSDSLAYQLQTKPALPGFRLEIKHKNGTLSQYTFCHENKVSVFMRILLLIFLDVRQKHILPTLVLLLFFSLDVWLYIYNFSAFTVTEVTSNSPGQAVSVVFRVSADMFDHVGSDANEVISTHLFRRRILLFSIFLHFSGML